MLTAVTFAMVASLAPPQRYDYEPPVSYRVSYVSQAKVQKICAREAHGAGDLVLGCSFADLGLVYVAKGLSPKVQDVILRHEKAHLNGWKHSHFMTVAARN